MCGFLLIVHHDLPRQCAGATRRLLSPRDRQREGGRGVATKFPAVSHSRALTQPLARIIVVVVGRGHAIGRRVTA